MHYILCVGIELFLVLYYLFSLLFVVCSLLLKSLYVFPFADRLEFYFTNRISGIYLNPSSIRAYIIITVISR